MTTTEERLGQVEDPALFHRLSELGMLRSATAIDNGLEVRVAVPVADYPAAEELRVALAQAAGLEPGKRLELAVEVMGEEERDLVARRLRAFDATEAAPHEAGHAGARENPFARRRGPTRVLAICSGKGGVGKSTVAVNLAVALRRGGHRVGILDADIYGFSVPRMMGVPYAPLHLGNVLVPPVAHGVRVVSMGFFVDEDQAVAWRGPMLHNVLEQFLVDVHWGELDFLVVDLPPGTGDVPMSVAQQLPGAECYVVTTPQPAAERVAQRAGALARQLRLPLRGVIENYSYFAAPDGARYEIFGSGGGAALAETLGVELLGQVPLELAVREGADEGQPIAVAHAGGEAAAAIARIAERIVALGPARVYRKDLAIS